MLPDEKIKCPATGFARTCRDVVVNCSCPKFISIKGQDPQTGEVRDQWGCSDSFLPLLLIETAKHTRHTTAALNSFRNEVVQAEEDRQRLLARITGNSELLPLKS